MPNPPRDLYTADDLIKGFSAKDDLGYTMTYDFSVFRRFVLDGGAVPSSLDVRRTQADHDAYIGDGLRRFLDGRKSPLVGVMGGHSVTRDSAAYADIAKLTRHLANGGYLIVTGGGPGVMEAAHVGVAFSTTSPDVLQQALGRLSRVPKFPILDGLLNKDGSIADGMHDVLIQARDWLQAALDARSLAPKDLPISLAIPTWLYGAEPTMPFATHYGKYFQNSIREEALINNSRAGIVYGQGGGGTVREVFQDVELNYYAKEPKDFTPMIFFDRNKFWQRQAVIRDQHVAQNGIKLDDAVPDILRAARYGMDRNDEKVKACMDKVYFAADADDYRTIDDILAKHAATAKQNMMFALNADPLRVTTSRINRA